MLTHSVIIQTRACQMCHGHVVTMVTIPALILLQPTNRRAVSISRVSQQPIKISTIKFMKTWGNGFLDLLIVLAKSSALLKSLWEHLVFPDVSVSDRLSGEPHGFGEVRPGNLWDRVLHFFVHVGVLSTSLLLYDVLLDGLSDCKLTGSLANFCQVSTTEALGYFGNVVEVNILKLK